MMSWVWKMGLVLSALAGLSAQALSGISSKVIVDLDKSEPYGALLVHAGLLWVGHSRHPEYHYLLEAYSADGTRRVAALKFPHSVSYLYPYGPSEMVVVGKTTKDNEGPRTYYSRVRVSGSKVTLAKTYKFSLQYQIDQFAGEPGSKMYFGNPGDRNVVTPGTFGVRALKATLYGAGPMFLWGDVLFVVERPALGGGNLARVDLKTEQVSRTFSAPVHSLGHLTPIPWLGRLAASEFAADRVILVDKLGKLTGSVTVEGRPRGLALVGKCLTVVTQTSRKIAFYDLSRETNPKVDEWDISGSGKRLENPIYLAADVPSRTLYVRSVLPCVFCNESSASVMAFQQSGNATFERCLK